ncbi:MAG: pantetheine-phosphate adenylyltransferase [Candidatus Marinimicrobia bacterium CG08_land_8_20_14_0_20_45_22]|nr:MAG: pantetheine-phosphate adenylyltransferase [Candidatus Marinimicrobia bacterium CG08_land_8_20_14_0_20_45_22]
MKIAIYPGTFDPITNGHLDILERASAIFDLVYIAIAVNVDKKPVFTVEERLEMIRKTTEKFDNVRIDHFTGLVVNYASKVHASVIIRGLRAVSDFEFEFQMALTNRQLNEDIDTVFLMPRVDYTYLSSSTVREIAKFGGDVSQFVPEYVKNELYSKLKE